MCNRYLVSAVLSVHSTLCERSMSGGGGLPRACDLAYRVTAPHMSKLVAYTSVLIMWGNASSKAVTAMTRSRHMAHLKKYLWQYKLHGIGNIA